MESSTQNFLVFVTAMASLFAIGRYLICFWLGIRDRGTALTLGIFFLYLGISVNWVIDVVAIWLGEKWKLTPTLLFLRNFTSYGVAALAANFIATAFFLPTEEQQRLETEKLARAIAREIRNIDTSPHEK